MTTAYRLSEGKSAEGMARAIAAFLENEQGMETQIVETTNGEHLVQARVKNGKYKQFIGMDRTTTVRFIPTETNVVTMEIGNSKWVDKGIAMTVSMFVLWPLTVTSGIGMYKQNRLPKQICAAAQRYQTE